MITGGRDDPVLAPHSADQNTPLDSHWWHPVRRQPAQHRL